MAGRVVFMLLLLAAPVRAQDFDAWEIYKKHRQDRESIRTGRISFTVERYRSLAAVEGSLWRVPEDRRADATAVESARTNGAFAVDFIFDTATDSYAISSVCDEETDERLRKAGLAPAAGAFLSKTAVESVVGKKKTRYGVEANVAEVSVTDVYFHMFEKDLVPGAGYFLGGGELEGASWKVTQDADDVALFHAVCTHPRAGHVRLEFTFDKSFDFRLREWRMYENDRLRDSFTAEYREWGSHVFPSQYEMVKYDENSQIMSREKYVFTSVELNVPIAASEFEVDIPDDAEVHKSFDFWEFRPGALRRQMEEVVEDLELPLKEEAPTAKTQEAPEAESAPVAVREAPSEEPAAQDDDGPSAALIAAIVLVAVAVLVAASLVLRRRSRV